MLRNKRIAKLFYKDIDINLKKEFQFKPIIGLNCNYYIVFKMDWALKLCEDIIQ